MLEERSKIAALLFSSKSTSPEQRKKPEQKGRANHSFMLLFNKL
jgi:hypothetical protein